MVERTKRMAAAYENVLSRRFDEQVKPLLAINDKLRKLTKLEDDINMSTIVAVGDQSHGKSSVIEALSGVFLPRGQGMKTKLPLSLHLREAPEEKAIIRFSGREDQTVCLGDVAKAINELTDEVVGEDVTDVKDEEIDLTVFRPGQVDLDLIDLPGMTRATGEYGPQDIETRITSMYTRYMRPSEAVLLNVVAAQMDTGNSSGFKMSIDFDKDRKRTLLCYTKMDSYMDGPECFVSRVRRDLETFSLGPSDVFCVRNRSHAESEAGMSLKDAACEESNFFADPEGPALAANEQLHVGLGRVELAHRLAHIQRQRIVEALPKAMAAVSTRLDKLQQQLNDLPRFYLTDEACYMELQKRLTDTAFALSKSREGRTRNKHNLAVIDLQLNVDEAHAAETCNAIKETNGIWEVSARWTLSNEMDDKEWSSMVEREMENAGLDEYSTFILQNVTRSASYNVTCDALRKMGVPTEPRLKIVDIFNAVSCYEKNAYRLVVRVCDKEKESCFSYSVQVSPTDDLNNTKCVGGLEAGRDAYFYFATSPRSVSIQVVVRADQRGVLSTSCSSFAQRKDSFVEAVRMKRGNAFFFSETFFNLMKDNHLQYRGHDGLPGTLPSHVAVDMARILQQEIYPLGDEFADDIAKHATKWAVESVEAHLNSYPGLQKKATDSLRQVIDSARQRLKEDLITTQKCFDQVMLEDHYYSFILRDIRAAIEKVRTGEQKLGFLTAKVLREMSNHDTGVLDDTVRLAAYWKAMCKEFSGHVAKLVKLHLFSFVTEKKIVSAILQESIGCADGTLVQLMAPSNRQRQARIALEDRITNLEAAKIECEAVVAQLLS